jgi:Ca2+:H+ antiporter
VKDRATVLASAVLVPASVVAWAVGSHTPTFILSALAMIPLAGILGDATEDLAAHAGPRVGGLLNATFGNAAELIIGVFLVSRGEIAVVRASITGSIVGNLLLILGASFLAGGLRHRELRFSAQAAGVGVASMALAAAGVLMPSIYAGGEHVTAFRIEAVSVGVAVVLLILYVATLVFSLTGADDAVAAPPHTPRWSSRTALIVLAATGALVAFESELLVGALEPTVRSLGLSRLWVGLILVPIVGNAAEHSSAVRAAVKQHTDLTLQIAVGSSAQVALVVTPLLVFAGLGFGHHLTLSFSAFEIGAIALSVVVVAFIVLDGQSNWLEGSQLLGVYVILAVTSFYLGQR